MNFQNIIIYDYDDIFNILNEIKEILKFNIIYIKKTNKELTFDENKYGNFLILVKENNNIKKILPNAYINRIVKIKNYPIKLENLIEILNVQFERLKFMEGKRREVLTNGYKMGKPVIVQDDKKQQTVFEIALRCRYFAHTILN